MPSAIKFKKKATGNIGEEDDTDVNEWPQIANTENSDKQKIMEKETVKEMVDNNGYETYAGQQNKVCGKQNIQWIQPTTLTCVVPLFGP